MDQRRRVAEAALAAGDRAAAIVLLSQLVAEAPADDPGAWLLLARALLDEGRGDEALTAANQAALAHPSDAAIRTLEGALLRRAGRLQAALAAFDAALSASPVDVAAHANRATLLMQMGRDAEAVEAFASLHALGAANADVERQWGRALVRLGRAAEAAPHLRAAVALAPRDLDARLALMGALIEAGDHAQADAASSEALRVLGPDDRLLDARAIVLRRSHRLAEARALVEPIAAARPEAAFALYHLGCLLADEDRPRANDLLRRALALEPGRINYRIARIEGLEHTTGGDEGGALEEAAALAKGLIEGGGALGPNERKVLWDVLVRVCDFDAQDRLGTLAELAKAWAGAGRHTALLKLFSHVKGEDDRKALLDAHRDWGRAQEAHAAAHPIQPPHPRPRDGRIRLGFLSSDLRYHPVGYFALPLFEHRDPRFDLFVYSFERGEAGEDPIRKVVGAQAVVRRNPDMAPRDAAQMIADDRLDMLIELGGSTAMNRLEVMAWRMAPVQASWLGYPHSAGLSTIDRLILDPCVAPERAELMVEQPLMMPRSWIAMGGPAFSDAHVIAPGLPEDQAGGITFGVANNPYKFSRGLVGLWARAMGAVPGSRIVFIRPEGGAPAFRANLTRAFEASGIAAERVEFRPVRGRHMALYNEVDISLDTAPLTGGTTTVEALWMGVPVVSLRGPAIYERLSASILTNAGLPELVLDDEAGFVAAAAALAQDRARRLELRRTLRPMLKASPLGDAAGFAADFYARIASVVGERT